MGRRGRKPKEHHEPKERYIWMKVSLDEYELPMIVADTSQELADMCGVSQNTVLSCVSKVKAGVYGYNRSSYCRVKVMVSEDDY